MLNSLIKFLKDMIPKLIKGIWLFPAVLTVLLIILTTLKISGSSIGIYHEYFYGPSEDSALLYGKPRAIRSDEWLVNSQAIIAQSAANFTQINKNIGIGQDMSVVIDAPYKDWSIIFKPHNWGFFVMPLETAFALRWWIMGYLLMLGAYFFVLKLLPNRLVAASLAVSIFFSGFVQWWYAYGTIGSLYFSFFIAITVMSIFSQVSWKKRVWQSIILIYLCTCFALVLYPPFQIPCALVTAFFLIGYLLNNNSKLNRHRIQMGLVAVALSIVATLILVGAFIQTRRGVVDIIMSTDYPGERVINSGGVSPVHYLSSHLGFQFTFQSKADQYLIDDHIPTNQSEASNFPIVLPFIIIPCFLLLIRERLTARSINWPTIFVLSITGIFFLELFVPSFTPFSKLLLLDKVGGSRTLIGLGLAGFFLTVLLIMQLVKQQVALLKPAAFTYSFVCFLVQLAIAMLIVRYSGSFINTFQGILLSLPFPIAIYLLLTGRVDWATIIIATFAVISTSMVNPLYRGLKIVTDNPTSLAIREIAADNNLRWVSDGGYLMNFAAINGAPTISAVYSYPQAELWHNIPNINKSIYNRYAHVGLQFSGEVTENTSLKLLSPDSFLVITNPCSDYLRELNVGFILTQSTLNDPCLEIIKSIKHSARDINIYKLI